MAAEFSSLPNRTCSLTLDPHAFQTPGTGPTYPDTVRDQQLYDTQNASGNSFSSFGGPIPAINQTNASGFKLLRTSWRSFSRPPKSPALKPLVSCRNEFECCSSLDSSSEVLDGHDGDHAASFAEERLLGNILKQPCFASDIPQAMRKGFVATDCSFGLEVANGTQRDAGTTALAVLLWHRTLYVANLGDCRAVLSQRGRALQLSNDQNPENVPEQRRVLDAGGYFSDGRLCGQLTVTRCMGDWSLDWPREDGTMEQLKLRDGSGLLISDPEVARHDLEDGDEFAILACDGLWSVLSNQRAVELARLQLQGDNNPSSCAKRLVSEAMQRHSSDNISVVVLCFQDTPPMRREAMEGQHLRKTMSSDAVSRLNEFLR
uniref:Protein phosphatase 2C homolog 2/3 n=1 Tax=Tetraselmis sp. GSL018 TaxID=582737 RepID=A0A061RXD2_9CHLO